MKPTSIATIVLVLLMLLPEGARADRYTPQPPPHKPQLLHGTDFPVAPYDLFLEPAGLAKTAGTASRIASRYAASGTAAVAYRNKDSVYYTYSGSRGGDLNGNINFDQARYFRWDTVANAWKPSYLYIRSYDVQNRPTSEAIQVWSSSANSFVNNTRLSYSFNAQGWPTLIKTESWNPGTSSWTNFLQYTGFSYNTSGKLTSYLFQQWKMSTSSWANAQRYTGTYNTNGDETGWLTESWNASSSSWGNFQNETYAYNSARKLTRYVKQSWDAAGSRWRNGETYTYFYNGANQDIGYTYQLGDVLGSSWINRDSFSYSSLNTAGMPLARMAYSWNSNSWQPSRRYTHTYTSTNLESSALREDWNGVTYANKTRSYSAYNSFGQLTSAYGQSYGNSWGIGPGDANERYAYQSYATAVGTVASEKPAVMLYPVPASQSLQLSLQWKQPSAFSVANYDMAGRMLQGWKEPAIKDYNKAIAVGGFAPGIYSLRIQSDGGVYQESFAVQH